MIEDKILKVFNKLLDFIKEDLVENYFCRPNDK